MSEKEHQYYRRCALCDPDLIVCPVCNGSGKVPGPSSEDDLLADDLLFDKNTYPVTFGEVIPLSSTEQGEKKAKPISVIHWY